MKTNSNVKLSQWEKRVVSFKFIYSLIIDESLQENDMLEKLNNEIMHIDDYIVDLIKDFIKNYKIYKEMLSKYILKTWTIERIDYVDRAIIYSAIAERNAHKIDKNIIIDQSIITAKKYGNDSSYKFINFILDKVI